MEKCVFSQVSRLTTRCNLKPEMKLKNLKELSLKNDLTHLLFQSAALVQEHTHKIWTKLVQLLLLQVGIIL